MNVLNAIVNIGKDATVRYTPNNDVVCQFNAALTSGYGNNQVTTWITCNVWGKRAETLAPMLLKGTRIGITGEITNRPYKDKQGNEKYSLECRVNDVTLLGKKEGEHSSAQRQDTQSNDQERKQPLSSNFDDFDSDIPF